MKRKIAASIAAVALAVGGLMWASPAMADDEILPSEAVTQTDEVAVVEGAITESVVEEVKEEAKEAVTVEEPTPVVQSQPTQTEPPHEEHKVVVCKYVSKPGVAERLQTGQNPITPDENSIPWFHADGDVVFPQFFVDGQERSVAVRYLYDGEKPNDPTLEDCPAPEEPDTVVPNGPVVKDLCETENDHYGLPDVTAGVEYSRDGLDIIATITALGTVWGTLPEGWVDEGDGVARYAFNVELFTDENCEEVLPNPAAFDAEPYAATCDEDGALPLIELAEHVTLTWDREFDGPGVYTLTATADEGYEFPDGTTVKEREFTVLGAIGYQSEDPEAECYVDEEPTPATLATPSIHDECGTENDFANLPENSEGVTYYWYDEEDESELDVVAVVDEGYVVEDVPAGWTEEDGYFLYVQGDFTDVKCPTTPPAPPATTPPAPALAVTGGGDVNPLLPLGGVFASVLGIALALTGWLRRRSA